MKESAVFASELIRNLFSSDKEVVLIHALLITLIVVVVSSFLNKFRNKSNSIVENDWSSLYSDERKGIQATTTELKNIFDVKQNSPQVSSSLISPPHDAEKEKPFKSSYYYAHNDPNRIGGYKDGLKADGRFLDIYIYIVCSVELNVYLMHYINILP